MSDVAGLNLQEPNQVDWASIGASKYVEPPTPLGADGKPIVFYGTCPEIKFEETEDNYRRYLLDPIKLVKTPGGTHDGYQVRFTRASVKPWKNGANMAALMIKSAGVQAKPQVTAEYDATVKQLVNRPLAFNIDWEARNKDTGEKISGFLAFPIDQTTGKRKAILHQGDTYNILNEKGQPTGETGTVTSEVLFANARVTFFRATKQ